MKKDSEKSRDELLSELADLRRSHAPDASGGREKEKNDGERKLVGRIAHEFNNILTAIAGNIALAKMYAKPGLEVYDILDEAEKASLRAKYLVQQLFPLFHAGPAFRKPLLLQTLFRDTVTFALSDSPVKYRLLLPEDLYPVEADESQIRQVAETLVFLARQGMTGGGLFEVSGENFDITENIPLPLPEGKYVRITMVDHGPGLSEEDIAKMVDPSFGAPGVDDPIGLAAVLSVVRNHGGHLSVTSKLGSGTTYTLFLPATANPEMQATGDEQARRGEMSSRGKVLVMDDEEIVRVVIGRMLSQCGYEYVLSREGEEAVRLYEEALRSGEAFDAVIVDLIVPGGMGGKETIGRLRELDPGVKAIVSSGYSSDPVMAHFREYGFKFFLCKPYSIDLLCKTLEQVIRT